MMTRNAMIAIIAGIIVAAAIAGIVAATGMPNSSSQQGNQTTSGTSGQGKKITIDLNENLGLKEKS